MRKAPKEGQIGQHLQQARNSPSQRFTHRRHGHVTELTDGADEVADFGLVLRRDAQQLCLKTVDIGVDVQARAVLVLKPDELVMVDEMEPVDVAYLTPLGV